MKTRSLSLSKAPVTSSVALVTRSDALVPSSVLVTTSKAPVTKTTKLSSTLALTVFLVGVRNFYQQRTCHVFALCSAIGRAR